MEQKNNGKRGASKADPKSVVIPADSALKAFEVPEPVIQPEPVKKAEGKKMKSDVIRPVIAAEVVYNLTADQIEEAIKAGDVWWANGTPENPIGTREGSVTDVTLGADKSPTKLEEVQPYQKLVGVTFEGMILLTGGKAEPAHLRGDTKKADTRSELEAKKGVADHFNYGLDLEVKRPIRRELEKQLGGPDKAIKAMAKALLDLKMARNMEHALEKARKQYEEEMAELAASAPEGEPEEAVAE